MNTSEISEFPGFWRDGWRRLITNRPAVFALFTLSLIFFMALIGPFLSSHSYYEIHLEQHDLPPNSQFWFGTDELGRDLFARTWWGARISLFIGIAATCIDLMIGVVWGGAAALYGGRVEEIMMRLADILYAIPYLLVVIILTVIRGSGIGTILIAMSCTGWINTARIVRSQILQIKQLDYIAAAYLIGASSGRVLFRHLIPNAMGPIVAAMTLTIPTAIFTEAFLSFLGLGVQAPIASWGVMINDGLSAMRYYPWRFFCPVIMLTITILSFNVLGNALRDALDPRLRR